MPLKKITLSAEFDEQIDKDLFAIYSSSEDYFLAFQLNKTLGIQFKNVTETIEPHAMVPFFSRFIWKKALESLTGNSLQIIMLQALKTIMKQIYLATPLKKNKFDFPLY